MEKQLAENFDKRAAAIKSELVAKAASKETKGYTAAQIKDNILIDMKEGFNQLDSLRTSATGRKCVDIDFLSFVKEKWGFADLNNFYGAIGVSPSNHSVHQLMSMPDFNDAYRWLVPEVIREAVRLGLRKNPIYSSLIAGEETVGQPSVIMPAINMSDAMPSKLGEAETIPVGTVTFDQKTVKLQKVGTGIKVTDEVQMYVSLNLLSIYLQDVGVQLGRGLDTLAIDALVNGDQANGSEAAAVIGANTTGTLAYGDFTRAWVRMSRLGKLPTGMLSNEAPALEILDIAEFKALPGNATLAKINIQTPVPASQNLWIHGAMPSTNKVMLVDTASALLKLNSAALRVESERIASKQITGTYVSLTTGFCNLFRDARVIIDKSLAYSANPFPSWMDPGTAENIIFKD